ncbi:MAG: alanine racemase [Planctomycetota bacterium]
MPNADPPSDALSWVRVDLGRLAGNVAAVLKQTANQNHAEDPTAPVICGVVKKNAYGLGAATVARTLQRHGCGMLAVYSPREAEELVNAGLAIGNQCPVLVLMPVYTLDRRDGLYRAAAADGLHLTLHSAKQAEMLDDTGRRLGLRLPVHVHVDTGMSREGMSVDDASALWPRLQTMKGLRVAGLMSHLATADVDTGDFADFTEQQEATFDALVDRLTAGDPDTMRGVLLHTGNSYRLWRNRNADQPHRVRHVVRPGLGLYGYTGDEDVGVKPIVRWTSRIIRVRAQPAGRTVGYGATATLERDSVLALIPAGYGDGYPLALSNRGKVLLRLNDDRQATCRVVGRVNMDQLVIDVTTTVQQLDLTPEALLGREIDLYGDDADAPNAVNRLAEQIDSHAYELLCRLNPRLPRVYSG